MGFKFFRKITGRKAQAAKESQTEQQPQKPQPQWPKQPQRRSVMPPAPIAEPEPEVDVDSFMEPPSKNRLTWAEERAIIAAIKPSIARQRAQSRERQSLPARPRAQQRDSFSSYGPPARARHTLPAQPRSRESCTFPAHPRMSQARLQAAKAYWDAPLTGGEWHQHPRTGRLVPVSIIEDTQSSRSASPTDRFSDDTEAENDDVETIASSVDSDFLDMAIVKRPILETVEQVTPSRPAVTARVDSVIGELPHVKQSVEAPSWKTPGEEAQAFIAQLEGTTDAENKLTLRRSRSLPSVRSVSIDGSKMTVQIDGATSIATATILAPIRPIALEFKHGKLVTS